MKSTNFTTTIFELRGELCDNGDLYLFGSMLSGIVAEKQRPDMMQQSNAMLIIYMNAFSMLPSPTPIAQQQRRHFMVLTACAFRRPHHNIPLLSRNHVPELP